MTELEWQTCKDVRRMFRHLGDGRSQRHWFEWVVACCRHSWETLPDESRNVVEAAESYLLGTSNTKPELNGFLAAIMRVARLPNPNSKLHASFLRDILGNPFRPVTFEPDWRTSTVVTLAEGIYADRAFDRLPILADALEDAGCYHQDILDHCRGPGPHVRGCWVVDLVLEKE